MIRERGQTGRSLPQVDLGAAAHIYTHTHTHTHTHSHTRPLHTQTHTHTHYKHTDTIHTHTHRPKLKESTNKAGNNGAPLTRLWILMKNSNNIKRRESTVATLLLRAFQTDRVTLHTHYSGPVQPFRVMSVGRFGQVACS